jgi:lysine 6-dehydrogenase
MTGSILVLGAGLQGSACAYDLALREGFEVTLADRDEKLLERALSELGPARERVHGAALDVADRDAVRKLMSEHHAVVSGVPYFLNPALAEDAVESGASFTDMGGNTDLVLQELALDTRARARGVSIVPDMGLAPGLANLLAVDAMQRFEKVDSVAIRVGGLPLEPKPPLGYMMLFSMHGLINEYWGDSLVLEEGEVKKVPTFSVLEELEVPGVGALEAFPTSGGISTLPMTYRGKVRTMDYKTLRYPGHYARMRCIKELGLLDETPIDVPGGRVKPRDVFAACAEPRLTHPGARDRSVVIVFVEGERGGQRERLVRWIVDEHDAESGHSSMRRTTAYPVSIVSAMQARGEIPPGAQPAEIAVPCAAFVARLALRSIQVHEATSVVA